MRISSIVNGDISVPKVPNQQENKAGIEKVFAIGSAIESEADREESVIRAIEKANKMVLNHNTRAEFSIHEQTKAILVKIVDTDNNTVIREIPPEKILDLVAKFCELAGILVDERR